MVDTAANYLNVKKNMEKILVSCGRKPEDAVLVAVSKTKPGEMIQPVYDVGCRDFGENYVQEIMDKYEKLPSDIRWHMIGHLQTNKVKYIIDKVYMIHSVDSLHLAEVISKEAGKKNVVAKILLQVNVAEEDTKFGTTLQDAKSLYDEVIKLPNIQVMGLMTSAPYVENPEENRQYFANLRQLSVDLFRENVDNKSDVLLSMGMSNDYTVALQEGAGMIRVGTDIFGERVYTV